ncbi:hypothetical protein C1N83_24845 [Priestia aryabhattai]|uniref:hypothetical protein n=1 Tax=Priestia TaxID=2800373 RepID=UPI00064FE1AE|nr:MULTISPECIES: hypothetical protein [Priestia]KML30646.1 hypothetical protein VL11_05985 [Priestia aryabhattai]KMN99823.1 hypothetical protein ABV89_08020 [Priestia aryabhattai]KZE12773.1 hypothetical protein AVW12_04065 [Priestia aryabhattai]MBY0008364.1 hypothetical protein [Priestia aryabhattai]MBY0049901.1 hypothetical protein [Priestia aryabhattai]
MKKILLFTLVALLATFFIDRVYSERNQAQLQQTVINEIKKTNQSKEEASILDFNELCDFRWDKVYVFGPETTRSEVNEKLGFNWSEAKAKGIGKDKKDNFIVFVENDQVTQYLKIPASYGAIIPKTSVANES